MPPKRCSVTIPLLKRMAIRYGDLHCLNIKCGAALDHTCKLDRMVPGSDHISNFGLYCSGCRIATLRDRFLKGKPLEKSLTNKQFKKVLFHHKALQCNDCGDVLSSSTGCDVDHIRPLHLFANHESEANNIINLQFLCGRCHSKKCFQEEESRADAETERVTGVSKYFNPQCNAFNSDTLKFSRKKRKRS